MRQSGTLPLALAAVMSMAPAARRHADLPTTAPNPNTAPAGVRRDSLLTLDLDAVEARWHDGGGPGAVAGSRVLAFAERGRQPTIPGPLVRVPAGTTVRVSVHNALARPITFFLPTTAATDDSVIIAPGATGELAVRASIPGNFFYRATDGSRSGRRLRVSGALAGAMVVDTVGAPAVPNDRIFAIVMPSDSVMTAYIDSAGVIGGPGRFAFTINGLAWPRTERETLTVGDTAHWRIMNASWDVHPMHLHGFYYRVDEFTGLVAARDGQGDAGRLVVTERMSPWSAMRITWGPERPGNWLLHCHFSLHLAPPSPTPPPGNEDDDGAPVMAHANHALTGMTGLVIGITARPRPNEREAAVPRPARRLRLLVTSDSGFPASRPSQRFVIEENGRRTTSPHPGISPTLYLRRGQPVAITVVNQLAEYTGVHWHGMELQSYYDGVAGLSGSGTHLAPMIAPGDSFTAYFSSPRAGTFMYHSHVDDVRQQRAGLVGAMIVTEGPAAPAPDEYEVFLKGSLDRPGSPLEIDGLANPDTLVMRAGRPARLRLMSLTTVNPSPAVVITARADSVGGNVSDTLVGRWVPLAKDGADLPATARHAQAARQVISMGETYDFVFTPPAAGTLLRLEVRGAGGGGILLGRIPIRVQ